MSATAIATPPGEDFVVSDSPSPLRIALRRTVRRPLVIASLLWLFVLLASSTFSSILAPYGPLVQDLNHPLSGPTRAHPLGTDELGRDMLSRVMHGGGHLLVVALLTVVTAYVIGVTAGLVVGYTGGRLDTTANFIVNVTFSIPALVIVLAVAVIANQNLVIIAVAFGVLLSAGIYRITQASTRAARDMLYVDAARVAGVPRRRILARHILPNVLAPLIVQAFLLYSGAIVFLASISFLGLGFSPESPSWGQLVADATNNLNQDAWLMVPAGVPLILTTLSLNFIGAALLSALPTAERGTLLAPRRRAVPSRTAPGPADHEAADALLRVDGLVVSFPGPDGGWQPVVDGVSFSLRRGETLALVGESGCGKTMTALGMLGLVPPPGAVTGGWVVLDGVDLVGADERTLGRTRGARIALVSQEPMTALDPCMSVGALLAEPLRAHVGLSRAAARERALELLSLVGIAAPAAVAKSYPHQLSGGMAQRVAIALALAAGPDVLVADEPTSSLDVTIQAEILDLLRSLQAELGMAIVLVTHDLGVVADIADHAAVMYAGQIVEYGTTAELLRTPGHPYTRALLDAVPDPLAGDDGLKTIPGSVPLPRDWPAGCRFEPRCPMAIEACRAPVTMSALGATRESRCVRTEEMLREVVGR
jgi:peptide/nickel transport system permease protein